MAGYVIVPLNGSVTAERAVQPAAGIARQLGYGAWLVDVLEHERSLSDHERYLKDVSTRVHLRDVEMSVKVEPDPAQAIITLATSVDRLEGRRPLVCMSTHGRGRIRETLLGSVATTIVRELGDPVMLVGPRCRTDAGSAPFENVVVCLDGSVPAEAILPFATDLARTAGLRLHLVEVMPRSSTPDRTAEDDEPGDVLESGYLKRVSVKLAGAGVDVTWDVLHGDDPATAIVDYADISGRTLVTLATHGRTGRDLLTMGSVATAIVRAARGPVIVVRPARLD